MPVAHLICGPVGAGKTTLAVALAEAQRAVRFTLDEWVMALYGPDLPRPFQIAWAVPRIARCEEQIWKVARSVLEMGGAVVLDLGFVRREQRAKYRRLVGEIGGDVRVEVHVLDGVDAAERRVRVRARNLARAETFALEVTDAMFDEAETWWQPVG